MCSYIPLSSFRKTVTRYILANRIPTTATWLAKSGFIHPLLCGPDQHCRKNAWCSVSRAEPARFYDLQVYLEPFLWVQRWLEFDSA